MVSNVLIRSLGNNWSKKSLFYHRIQLISCDYYRYHSSLNPTASYQPRTILRTSIATQIPDRRNMTTTAAIKIAQNGVGDDEQQQHSPLIVMAGWLGCHPKSLRRFEELYIDIYSRSNNNTLNRNVRPTILKPVASPAMIVNTVMGHPSWMKTTTTTMEETTITGNQYRLLPPPNGWPSSSSKPKQQQQEQEVGTKSYKGSLEAYAWDVLQDIHNSLEETNSPYIVIHPFSNGGYLLWEMIRRILVTYGQSQNASYGKHNSSHHDTNNEKSEVLGNIRNKIRGIVLDSCPAMDIEKLSEAMRYISWEEQLDVLRYCSWDYFLFPYVPQWKQRVVDHASTYFTPLYHTTTTNSTLGLSLWQIPHIFLYSADDPLTNSIHLDALIQQREQREKQNLNQRRLTYYKRWEKSSHCGHYKFHPTEYRNEIEMFLQVMQNEQQQESYEIEPQNTKTANNNPQPPIIIQSKL